MDPFLLFADRANLILDTAPPPFPEVDFYPLGNPFHNFLTMSP